MMTGFIGKQTCNLPEKFMEMDSEQRFMFTPFIVTLCENTLTSIDIQNFLEAGLRIVRFKLGNMKSERLIALQMLQTAVENCCQKYDVASWPVAIAIDLSYGLIQTGYIREDLQTMPLNFKRGNFVELTCTTKYSNKCDLKRIYVDNKKIFENIKPHQEISVPVASINLTCSEIIDHQTVKCEIIAGGNLTNCQAICFRGLKTSKPPLTELDMELLDFAREYQFEVIVINSIRRKSTVDRARNFFIGCHMPKIYGSIGDQEGLDNVDEIIEACDGVILAREYLSASIVNINQMTIIQMNITAKCKRVGKPIFISGNIFQDTIATGEVSYNEVSDLTNIVLQGAGLIVRNATDSENLLKSLYLLSSICRNVESITQCNDLWELCIEPPSTADDGVVVASALAAQQYGASVIIVLTVTGKTAVGLSRIYSKSFIVAVTTNEGIARRLQLFRGVIPIVYNKKGAESWQSNVKSRVLFALKHCIQRTLLKVNEPYAVLCKAAPTSAFCDQLTLHRVEGEDQ